jgi:leader peptidase (prepilin peptidase)/N-methyltransferase
MSVGLALFGGAAIGMALGALMVPVTRRELAAALSRSAEVVTGQDRQKPVSVPRWHRSVLVIASGALPAFVLARVGWSIDTLPPLLLLLGLVQLAYCDLTRFLLPKPMVHATTAAVAIASLVAAGMSHDWHRLLVAGAGGAGLFLLFFAINLANPAWMAFGDVRLAPAVGLGLAWISPLALFQGFFLANVLAAVVGLALILVSKGSRKTALPFGLYLAVSSAVVIFLAT